MPALRNTIVATFIMVFVFALGSYLLPQLLGRPQHWTLSVLITDQAIYQSNMPFAAAMAVFLVLVTLSLVGLGAAGWTEGCGDMTGTLFRRVLFGLVALFLAAPLIVIARCLGQRPADAGLSAGRLFACAGTARSSPMRRGAVSLIGIAGRWRRWRRPWLSASPFRCRGSCGGGIAPWAQVFQMLGTAPFVLPPVITALGFLAFWTTVGAYGQPWTVVVGHGIFFVTLPLVTLSLGFASIDRSLVEAASTMGADDRTILRTIVLPLIRPYLISGFAFAFVLSLNEYIVAYMAVGFTLETLPIKIFNSLRYGYTPTMAAVSILFVAVAAVIFGLIARFGDSAETARRLEFTRLTDKPFRLALLQMEAVAGDIAANLAHHRGGSPRGRQRRSDLLVAPELALTGYGAGEAIRATAEPADGAQVAALHAIAAETGIAIVAGFAEAADGVVYNSAVCGDA